MVLGDAMPLLLSPCNTASYSMVWYRWHHSDSCEYLLLSFQMRVVVASVLLEIFFRLVRHAYGKSDTGIATQVYACVQYEHVTLRQS